MCIFYGIYWSHRDKWWCMTWKCLSHYWLFVRGTHWSPAVSHHKGQVMWSFGLSCDNSSNTLLNKKYNFRWFKTPVTLMWYVKKSKPSGIINWGPVTNICVSNINIIGSDNGLSTCRSQAIFWTNADILLTWLLGTNFSEILSKFITFSSEKMHFKKSSGKWRPFCFGLNVILDLVCPPYTIVCPISDVLL